jgi:hypothetical protein
VSASAEQQVRAERVAALLVRLIRDPAFRAAFRRRPAEEARAFGLDDLAGELRERHRALQTLESRESTSGLAGLLLAAAAERLPMVELVRHADGPAAPPGMGNTVRALPVQAGPWPRPEEGDS